MILRHSVSNGIAVTVSELHFAWEEEVWDVNDSAFDVVKKTVPGEGRATK